MTDPYGKGSSPGPAYRYGTATRWSDIRTKRLVRMCFLASHYQEVMRQEFLHELALEDDGILQDECRHHNALLCCDTSHGHRYGVSVSAEDRGRIYDFARMALVARYDNGFLFAGFVQNPRTCMGIRRIPSATCALTASLISR